MILIVALLLVPFVSNRGERAPSRRPVAVLAVVVIYAVLGVLTYQGATAPWSPDMTAWSGDAVPEDLVKRSSPVELQGAVVFQNKNCRNCHALEGNGGRRGPDLTDVGTRLTRDQLIDQVSNGTPGGGNMPAYGKQISPRRDDRPGRVPGEPAAAGPAAGPSGRGGRREAMSHEPHARRLSPLLAVRPLAPRASLLLTAGVYLRGWLVLHRRDPRRWHGGRLAAFLGGLATIFLALASPIEPFASLLLQVHMVQHLLLMMVAPPLLWLGAPLFPLLRGLPRPDPHLLGRAPFPLRPFSARLFGRLTHPVAAWLLFIAATWVWHVPPFYDLALRSAGWHYLQHTCFLGAGLVFWYPVVRPYPARPRWSLWLLFPYLILADVQNTAPVGPADVLRPRALSLLHDGAAAGRAVRARRPVGGGRPDVGARLGGVPPAAVRGSASSSCSAGRRGARGERRRASKDRSSAEAVPGIALALAHLAASPLACLGFDLLRVPLAGPLPALAARPARPASPAAAAGRRRHLRRPARAAGRRHEPGRRAAVDPLARPGGPGPAGGRQRLLHGLSRSLLPRTLARRWLPQGWSWPRRLRSKWLAVVLIGAVPVGLRGVRSLGQPLVDRLDRPRLLRRPPSSSTASSAAPPSASTSARSASSTSCSRLARRWKYGARPGRVRARAGPRTASAAATASPAASCTCSSRGSRQHGLHVLPRLHPRLSSRQRRHACRPRRRLICGAIPSVPASAASAPPRPGGPRSWCWSSAPSPTPRAWSARWWSGRIVSPSLLGQRSPLLAVSLFLFGRLVVLPVLTVGAAAALTPVRPSVQRYLWRWRRASLMPSCPSGSACGWPTTVFIS